MRVAIAGAGGVGRSIAHELLDNGHEVLLIDRDPKALRIDTVARAEWLLADACELSSLEDARLEQFDVVVASSGDDKVNLVVALLAKTQFRLGRVVARINDPKNEWLFTDAWGVDVAVSPPRLMAALVEDLHSVNETGDAAALLALPDTDLLEFTLPPATSYAELPVADLALPEDTTLVAIVRDGHVRTPQAETLLAPGDELVFLSSGDIDKVSEELTALLRG